jgi:DNA-directed RNA polymerase specialized sigma24 family protein
MATKPKKKKKKKENYVNAKEFLQLIIVYYDSGSDEISRELGDSIYKIATGLSFAPNFINYSYREEMVGDALVKMVSAIHNKKFNVDSGYNPFSYFTTIAFHAFINRIKKEKRQKEVIEEYKESIYDDLMNSSGSGTVYTKQNSDEEPDY